MPATSCERGNAREQLVKWGTRKWLLVIYRRLTDLLLERRVVTADDVRGSCIDFPFHYNGRVEYSCTHRSGGKHHSVSVAAEGFLARPRVGLWPFVFWTALSILRPFHNSFGAV